MNTHDDRIIDLSSPVLPAILPQHFWAHIDYDGCVTAEIPIHDYSFSDEGMLVLRHINGDLIEVEPNRNQGLYAC